MTNKCDVIIPVYNAFEVLKDCVKSVIENTDLKRNSLVLINDKSTDERISPYLESLKSEYPDINLFVKENEENLGFVKTVNRGMKESENDVLLLNSDTVVPENWLEKINRCAYLSDKTASVTPLSNNATLTSVPEPLKRNEIPTDIGINEYNALIEKYSYREYPVLPTAHGFCMYIRRDALTDIGYLDEESFGKGYGEENDFSYRAIKKGYKNLLCDDTLVYHLESKSFGNEREKIISEHEQILKKRYPKETRAQADWLWNFPLKKTAKSVFFAKALGKKPNVLVLIHDFGTSSGGTTLHLRDLMRPLLPKINFHVFHPSDGFYKITSVTSDGETEALLPCRVPFAPGHNFYNEYYKKALSEVLDAYNIDCVHVHHMIGHFFDVADLTKEKGIRLVVTLHDFYSLCPTVNMLYAGERYCGDDENPDCKECMKKLGWLDRVDIPCWRKEFLTFLKKADNIIVPSLDTKKRVNKVFPELDITVTEHGADYEKSDYTPALSSVFNVAVIGVLCRHKGGYLFSEIIKENKNPNIRFHAFGSTEIDELAENKDNYVFHGRYEREKLSALLKENKINLICFLQIWPETYSYTVNEAVAAGIPVFSLDMGAGAIRVKENSLGWTLPPSSSAKEISDFLNKLSEDETDYLKAVESVKNYRQKTVEEMSKEYEDYYSKTKTSENPERMKKFLADEEVFISGLNRFSFRRFLGKIKRKLLSVCPDFIKRAVKKIIRPFI